MSRALVLLLAVLLSVEAWGYERTRVPNDSGNGPFLYWKGHRIYYVLNEQGSASAGPSSLDAARASFEAWTEPDCTDLEFAELPVTASSQIGYDKDGFNSNLVVWRERNCTDVNIPEDAKCLQDGGCNNAFNCWEHAPETIAVTTTTFNNRTGELVDADIELNGASFTFSTVDMPACPASGTTSRPPSCVATDIQNTLTHEIGHVIGLDHVTDPSATMYMSAQLGETEKRTLEQDDIDGLCEIYPASAEDDVKGSGCGCANGAGAAALGLVPLLLWALRPRRRGGA